MDSVPAANDQFTELMVGVREGSPAAIQQLVDGYGHHVLRAIRRHLNHRLRNLYDSIDFSQAVWGSFFRQTGSLPEFKDPSTLIAYLVRMSKNKVIDECRKRLQTQRYNVKLEQNTPDTEIRRDHRSRGEIPTPSDILTAKETIEQLLANQPSCYRNILSLRATGATFAEIAEDTGLNERSIRRVIKRLESQAQK